MKRFLITIFILLSTVSLNSVSALATENPNLKFITLGNVRAIADDKPRLKKLIDTINSENPDYVFILGDSHAWDQKIYKAYQKRLKAKVFYAAGNYDLKKKHIEGYQENVKYLEKLIKTPQANFIIINSSDDINSIKSFLEESFKEIGTSTLPTILMTHHRIWDDTLLSHKSSKHYKSYLFSEIQPLIKDKVDYIFAGDSNKQYFGHGKSSSTTAYFASRFADIICYSVGMGHGKPKSTFVTAELNNNSLTIKPNYASLHRSLHPPKIPNKKLKFSNKESVKKVKRELPVIKRKAFLSGIVIGLGLSLILIAIAFILGIINIPSLKSKAGTKASKLRSL